MEETLRLVRAFQVNSAGPRGARHVACIAALAANRNPQPNATATCVLLPDGLDNVHSFSFAWSLVVWLL